MLRFKKNSFLYKLVVIALPGILLVGGIAAYPAYILALQWRSQYLAKQSTELAEEGQVIPAFQKALSAHYLTPDDLNIHLNLARKASNVDHPQNLQWWMDVLEHPDRNGEDLLNFLKVAIHKNELKLASNSLSRYREELPQTEESWSIQFLILTRFHKMFEAAKLAEMLIEEGHDNWMLHQQFIETMDVLGSPDAQTKKIKHLRVLCERPDETGMRALRHLAKVSSLEIEEVKSLVEKIRSHPLKTKADILTAYSIEIHHSLKMFADVKDEILAQFDLRDIEDLKTLTTWLASENLHGESAQLLSDNIAQKDRQLFLNLLSSKINLGKEDEAFDLTLNPADENPLDSAENFVARARSHLAKGNKELYRKNLRLAVEIVDIRRYVPIEYELIAKHEWDLLAMLYGRLIENPETEQFGIAKLLIAHYSTGNDVELQGMARDLSFDYFEGNPSMQSFLAYVKILYGIDIEASRMVLEKLVADYPNISDFRIYLALVYKHLKKDVIATNLFKEITNKPDMKDRRALQIASTLILEDRDALEKFGIDYNIGVNQKFLKKEKELLLQMGIQI